MPNSYPQVLQRIISSFLAAVFLCPFLGNKMRIIRIMFITRRMFHTFAEMGDAWDLSRIRSQCYNIYREIFFYKSTTGWQYTHKYHKIQFFKLWGLQYLRIDVKITLQFFSIALAQLFKVQGFFICHIIVIQGITRSEMQSNQVRSVDSAKQ